MIDPGERSGANQVQRDDDDWEKPVWRAPADLMLHFEAFDGPIDFLLEMALRQKIDLGRISVLELADQFQEAVTLLAGEIPIERRADWLVMAARLIQLRARLMFPASEAAEAEAQQEAVVEVRQLLELGRMRAAAKWLSDRPQLGIDVFARPAKEVPAREGGYVALMEACLFVLEIGPSVQAAPSEIYKPIVRDYWTVNDAISHVQMMLAEQPDGTELLKCLPPTSRGDADWALRKRAAVASTLMASLELAKAGDIVLAQAEPFVDINLRAAASF